MLKSKSAVFNGVKTVCSFDDGFGFVVHFLDHTIVYQ